jgi:hypothetical protein
MTQQMSDIQLSLLVRRDDWIAQLANSLDMNLHHISGAEKHWRLACETYAGWSSCRNDIAWFQGDRF